MSRTFGRSGFILYIVKNTAATSAIMSQERHAWFA